VTIPLVCQMWVENLTSNSSETQDFDGEFKILKICMQQQIIIILKPFFSFMLGFQPHKAHNMLAHMLDPRYKGLKLVINYVGKEQIFQITRKYDKHVLFLLLICTYKVLNPSDTCERALIVLHPKILKPLVCMITWIWMRTWLYR
jgi:hypothetical protein